MSDAMSQRYFVEVPIEDEHVELAGSEAHHLLHVMRCRLGEKVVLFDGRGAEFDATVTQLGRSVVRLMVIAKRLVDRELTVALHLGVALPKGDRQRWLIEKAVELGVTRLTPLVTTRGVAQPTETALERLQRAGIEAAKQCGRNRLMEIAEPIDLAAFCQRLPSDQTRWLAHVAGQPLGKQAFPSSLPASISAAVGPEGGFTDQEVQTACGLGWQAVTLGTRILRVETAAIALAAHVAILSDQNA